MHEGMYPEGDKALGAGTSNPFAASVEQHFDAAAKAEKIELRGSELKKRSTSWLRGTKIRMR
jgi:hypothetical protein